MTDKQKKQQAVDDRRSQLGLRALIDEMLAQVRELNRHASTLGSRGACASRAATGDDHGARAGRGIARTQEAVAEREDLCTHE